MSTQPDPSAPKGSTENPSDAILTLPNVVTFARLALIPVFLWLALGPENIGAAWIVGFVLGSTDWIDGKIARRYNQVSKLGIAIDPFFDRLAVAAAATVIIMLELAPLWTVVVVLARDGLLLAMIPFLSAKGVPRPAVTWSGKAGSFGTMWAFGVWLGAAITEPPLGWVRFLGWLCFIPGILFSYYAALEYARMALASLRAQRSPIGAG
ncbi:MAG: CDP-alcohol phosphatidyltransferase family protein [Actinomycetota bacterium]